MMGYTHAAIGACGAIVLAIGQGDYSPELFVVASLAGTLGGVAPDIDTRDHKTNPKVTDASRSRYAALGLLGVCIVIGFILDYDFMISAFQDFSLIVCGIITFAILMLLGHFSKHRTFSHSLLFVILISACVYCIYPTAMIYFLLGGLLHLVFDMLNNPFEHHGIWLLYPLKTGKGIAFGFCKAARTGNKIIYFVGISVYVFVAMMFIIQIDEIIKTVAPLIVIVYLIIVLHFVRKKSEREQRHIMHIRGEI